MENPYLIKIGEIALKGRNRAFFEGLLFKNIKRKLNSHRCTITGKQGRYYLSCTDADKKVIDYALSTTFGVVAFGEVRKVPKSIEAIKDASEKMCEEILYCSEGKKFKIEARRSDKSFTYNSYQIASIIGQHLRDTFPQLSVDVKTPDWIINIEIRETCLIYGPLKHGPGGLPVGTAGRGILLLSGGIDSPVAGYLMAKRGLKLDAVYYHTYPYTSDEARDKVVKLAQKLSPFLSGVDLLVIPFTDIQIRIKERAKEEEMTLLMRACMMKIAEIVGLKRGAKCLVTGESLGQVASQTVESMRFTESCTNLPVFRPLIGFNKEEIVELARKLGTFDISVLPYDDCCTLFAPRRPIIKPNLKKMSESYSELEVEKLIEEAAENTEIIHCP
ncbi:MAG: tRNA 4-thiouridine(8) synthase ThiI [Spirochaetes bacterium]|nr:MAG: tRNA 4-thiouridine(8) synthase ThiI [Spirochaetota bacterium]